MDNIIDHREQIHRINILGVGVSAIDIDDLLRIVDSWIDQGERQYVCVTSVHGIIESQNDFILKKIHNNAGLVTPDGMPLVWLSWLKGFKNVTRVYGPDLMLALCEHSISRGYRHFFYGAAPGIPEQLSAIFQQRFKGIKIVGTFSPPFRRLTNTESENIINQINNTRPDIVWVGLSTPKQELWMAEHRNRLSAPVLIGVGAAFDFHSGSKVQAPRWLQPLGIEWLFRMFMEPKRLWKRYMYNNPKFIWLVLKQEIGIIQYRIEI